MTFLSLHNQDFIIFSHLKVPYVKSLKVMPYVIHKSSEQHKIMFSVRALSRPLIYAINFLMSQLDLDYKRADKFN